MLIYLYDPEIVDLTEGNLAQMGVINLRIREKNASINLWLNLSFHSREQFEEFMKAIKNVKFTVSY